MPRYEPFRTETAANQFAQALIKAGRTPLVIEGRPDKYDRTIHMVIWFAGI